ncbi:MAG: hypothetical protein P8Y53_12915 [Pseudolabrys sp.]
MRNFTAPLVLIGLIGVLAFGGRAQARDVYLHKHTAAELKSICAKVNGKFTQDSSSYDCGTDCKGNPGTACNVFCRPGKRCVAQVNGGRRPHDVMSALKGRHRH